MIEFTIFVVIVVILISVYAFRNLNYDYGNDHFFDQKGEKLGFSEKVFQTKDGNEICYYEGPNNGIPILMIHGQMVSKEDYAKVLPDLSKEFHVFAVDCYGHGKSSKNPETYNAISIRDDLISFIENVIKEKTIVTGHSSGALISATIAAKAIDKVSGLILEDGPFFSTEKGRAENTFAYQDFKIINDFLDQNQESNYTKYYIKHAYMKNFFNKEGKDNWSFLVEKPYTKLIDKGNGKMPIVWYYPVEMGLNSLIFLTRNLQDGTGNYDLRFGKTFYDFSWFNGFNQKESLSAIKCPTYILHVAPQKSTAPSYYDENGILLSAMDEKDAELVHSLIERSILKEGYESSHNIHADLPKVFIETFLKFKKIIDNQDN